MTDVKPMANPMHPGEFIVEVYLKPVGISGREFAKSLQLSTAAVCRMLAGTSSVSADMAQRLSEVLGRSPESWLAMQNIYDLAQLRKVQSRPTLQKLISV
ncbi:MAG: HigA family addiction module antitoxin [Agromyces sp.]